MACIIQVVILDVHCDSFWSGSLRMYGFWDHFFCHIRVQSLFLTRLSLKVIGHETLHKSCSFLCMKHRKAVLVLCQNKLNFISGNLYFWLSWILFTGCFLFEDNCRTTRVPSTISSSMACLLTIAFSLYLSLCISIAVLFSSTNRFLEICRNLSCFNDVWWLLELLFTAVDRSIFFAGCTS